MPQRGSSTESNRASPTAPCSWESNTSMRCAIGPPPRSHERSPSALGAESLGGPSQVSRVVSRTGARRPRTPPGPSATVCLRLHVRGTRDEVDEHPEDGEEEDEEEPQRLRHAVVVRPAEVVDERPEDHEEHEDEEREEDERPEDAQQRIVIGEHRGLLSVDGVPIATLRTPPCLGITRTG